MRGMPKTAFAGERFMKLFGDDQKERRNQGRCDG
jgi:hypothetical protein